MFHETSTEHLETWTSQITIQCQCLQKKGRSKKYSKRTFSRVHYEDMWSPYNKCQEIIQSKWMDNCNWNYKDPVTQFKKTTKDLLAGGREKKLKQLLKDLKAYRESNNQYVSGTEIRIVEKQIDDLLIDEEIYWRHRSKAVWLPECDKNTKFFHSKATARKRKNRIEQIIDENNKQTKEAKDIKRIFCEYSDTLFTSTNPSQHQVETALKDMPCKVSEEMNA